MPTTPDHDAFEVTLRIEVPNGTVNDDETWSAPSNWNWQRIFDELDSDLPPNERRRAELIEAYSAPVLEPIRPR